LICLAGLFGLPDRTFAAVRTWDGGGANDNWTTPNNWVGNVAPVAGDSLVFPAGFEGTTVNTFPIDTVFAALTAAGGYTLSGNRIVVGLDISAVPGTVSGVVLIQLAIKLIDAPNTHTIVMTADSGAELSVAGVVHGPPSATLRKRGAGIMTLQVANLYAGLTVIEAGRLAIRSPAALGSNTSNTMVLEGGTLDLQVGGATITEPLALLGDAAENDPNGHAALVALENATWSAPITLQGAGAPLIRVPAVGVTLTVSSVIGGSEGLEIDGRGSLVMSGVSSNTYFGMTTVWPGTLVLDKSAGAVAVPAGLVINGLSPLVALVSLAQLEQIQGAVAVNRAGRLDLNGRNETIGALSLMGGEVKTGTGVLTLGGNITVVQSTALALISGKLSLGVDTRTLDVQGADSPAIDISAVISSPQQQGLIKTGPGYARLSGANTYVGPTTVLDGALRAAHSSAFGDAAAGTSLAPSSRLEIEVDIPLEPLYAEGGPNFLKPTLAVVAAGLRTWGGPIVISGRLRTYTNPSGPLRMSGVISGTGELRMDGAGIVELGGNNVYAGNTIVGARVALTGSHRIPDSSRVELPSGPLNLAGFDETVGGIWGGSQGQILLGGGTLTVITQPGNTDVYAGTFGGNGSVTKMGAGTWTLAGTSASTAPITVAAGTLRVTGSLAHLVTVQGGTLEGTGSVGGIVAASGTVRPGASPGVLHSKSVTLAADVSLAIAINGPCGGHGARATRRHRKCEPRERRPRAHRQPQLPAGRRRRSRHRRQRWQ
jgi:fibronectin-binding autotransporter adhesin